MKTFILKFKGEKEDIHKYFKMLCAKYDISMTDRIIDLMAKDIKEDEALG